jgi:ribosome-associated translation inhibitor RaiA
MCIRDSFILNDIEYPTPYGKFMQVKMELVSRYSRLVDAHFDIKETEIKAKMKERDLLNATDDLERQLLEVQLERLQVELHGKKSAFEGLLDETRRFFSIYASMPEFHNLTPDEAHQLEADYWCKKALNMPTEFEQRYGKDYMERVIGKERYEEFRSIRARAFGLLPRELLTVRLLEGGGVS